MINPFYTEVTSSIKKAKSKLDKALNAYLKLISGYRPRDNELSIKCIPCLYQIHCGLSKLKRVLSEANHEQEANKRLH